MWKAADLRIIDGGDEDAIAAVLDRSAARNTDVERSVAAIVGDVRARGDAAVREYAARFDGLDGAFEVTRAEMRRDARRVGGDVARAIREAARNIRHVAAKQVPRPWRT